MTRVVLGNGASIIGNGSCAPGGCLWLTKDPNSSRKDWTKIDLGAHHDRWFNKTVFWQFEGEIPTCALLHKMHGWDLATCEARRSRGMCTTAILDTCGNHEDCPCFCGSTGGQVLTATSDSSALVCYDMFGCSGHGNYSSIYCVDIMFGIQ